MYDITDIQTATKVNSLSVADIYEYYSKTLLEYEEGFQRSQYFQHLDLIHQLDFEILEGGLTFHADSQYFEDGGFSSRTFFYFDGVCLDDEDLDDLNFIDN